MLTALLACLVCYGCATRANLREDQALLAPYKPLSVPALDVFGMPASISQTIVAHFKTQSYVFDVELQITGTELDFVALDGLGRRALTATWTGSTLNYTAADWLPKFVRPADILSDIAMAYGSEAPLAAALRKDGAILTDTATGRQIADGGRDLVVIDFGAGEGWDRPATLKNLALDYEIRIQSHAIGP
jgi:hypothetical protein